jgi:hypothetical protein
VVTEDDVDAFYAATSRGLLSQLYGLTRDWAEAQDCPQEAYAHKGLYVLHSDGTGSRLLVKGIAVRAARWSPESRSLPTTAGGVTLNGVHVADGSVRHLLSHETYDADSATLPLTHLPSDGANSSPPPAASAVW